MVDYTLEHIGLNLESESEALQICRLLSTMFNLSEKQGEKSIFAGTIFECLKQPFLGKNGHIALGTKELEIAVHELEQKGIKFRKETASFDEAGKMKNIYLEGEYAGFAIHIIRK